jgi:uncharacterized protein (TIRG00374 family)
MAADGKHRCPVMTGAQLRRLTSWALALVALAFVAWVIPVRDRCWDPAAPRSTRAAVSHESTGCVLHLHSGDVAISVDQCSRLQCEPGLETTFARARVGAVAALLALYGLGTLAWAGRWKALLSFADVDLSVWRVWRISIEAQAGGVVLPGGIGGDALRIASVMARGSSSQAARAPPAIAVASVLLDRAIGLSVIAAVAAALGMASRSTNVRVAAAPLEIALAAIPVGVATGLWLLRRIPNSGGPSPARWLPGGVERALAPVLSYVRDARAPRAMAKAVALSVVVAIIQFVVIRGLVFSVGGAPTDEKWVYVGTAMAFIVGAVPALPGGWGTADATYVFFFGLAGIAPSIALAVCLLFRLFWYLSGVAGAILYVTRGQASAERAQVSVIGKT